MQELEENQFSPTIWTETQIDMSSSGGRIESRLDDSFWANLDNMLSQETNNNLIIMGDSFGEDEDK